MKKQLTTEVLIEDDELLEFMDFDPKKFEIEEIDNTSDKGLIVIVMDKGWDKKKK